jgi:membrane-associated phospholipid phosphatase
MHNKIRLSLLLIFLAGVNYVETSLETWMTPAAGPWIEYRNHLAAAVLWLEGNLALGDYLSTDDKLLVYGYSLCYFLLFPALILGTCVALAKRSELSPYRVFVLAITVAYCLSLPFFLFFPVPERWAYPNSGAILLSDLWSPALIEFIRPFSGLDNCFPSSHVALTVVAVLTCFLFRVRFRLSVLAFGVAVLCSTLFLGVHWLADITAGFAVGVISVLLALRLDRWLAVGREPSLSSRPAFEVTVGGAQAA